MHVLWTFIFLGMQKDIIGICLTEYFFQVKKKKATQVNNRYVILLSSRIFFLNFVYYLFELNYVLIN